MGRSSEMWLRGYVAGTFTYATRDFPALWGSRERVTRMYPQRGVLKDVFYKVTLTDEIKISYQIKNFEL
jgi:hypothetical protein